MRTLEVLVEVDLDAADLNADDAERAIRSLLSGPIELADGGLMYRWCEAATFEVKETP